MPTTINRQAFRQAIEEDMRWLLRQPRTLERDHIELILKRAEEQYYGPEESADEPVESVRDQYAECQCGHVFWLHFKNKRNVTGCSGWNSTKGKRCDCSCFRELSKSGAGADN